MTPEQASFLLEIFLAGIKKIKKSLLNV